MMTIEEAIQHCEEAAKANRDGALGFAREHNWGASTACKACAQEHDQLAEWLTELKQRKENRSHWIDRDGIMICAKCGAEFATTMPFCGMCGAEMDGDSP